MQYPDRKRSGCRAAVFSFPEYMVNKVEMPNKITGTRTKFYIKFIQDTIKYT